MGPRFIFEIGIYAIQYATPSQSRFVFSNHYYFPCLGRWKLLYKTFWKAQSFFLMLDLSCNPKQLCSWWVIITSLLTVNFIYCTYLIAHNCTESSICLYLHFSVYFGCCNTWISLQGLILLSHLSLPNNPPPQQISEMMCSSVSQERYTWYSLFPIISYSKSQMILLWCPINARFIKNVLHAARSSPNSVNLNITFCSFFPLLVIFGILQWLDQPNSFKYSSIMTALRIHLADKT